MPACSRSTDLVPAHLTPPQFKTGQTGVYLGMQATINNVDPPPCNDYSGVDEELGLGTHQHHDSVSTPEGPVTEGSHIIKGPDTIPIIRESEVPSHVKCHQLMSVKHIEYIKPMSEEANINTSIELSGIQAKQKSKLPKEGKSKPKKGLAMGTFSPKQQAFMAVGRSSIAWDQLTCSPWSETDKELASHAIACAKESMKIMGTFMDDQDFMEMMMCADSQIHTQCAMVALKLAMD
ncbi:hypothetical protein FRC11_010592 [Ceratobasidium sp. 423]|nr:hypothetical protein FRC11_010592 [Ceratobasidium sp. 423]